MPIITQGARNFEMVAQSGSIRKAAERVNIAPSALNRQILNLEEEFGAKLFARHARGMRLTEAGESLLAQIRSWQNDERDLRARIEGIKGRSGTLRVGIMECLADAFLPEVIAGLRNEYRDFSLQVVVGGTADITGRMLSGDLDYSISFNTPGDVGLDVVHEMKMDIGLVVPPGHALLASAGVTLEQIGDHHLVIPDNSLTIGPLVRSMLEGARAASSVVALTNSVSLIKALVRQGDGLGLLTWADVYTEVALGTLGFVPVSGKQTFETLSFCRSRSGRKSALLRDYEAAVIRGLKQMQVPGATVPN